MTLAQLTGWGGWHQRSLKTRQRQLISVIRLALTAEPDDIESAFAEPPARADEAAREAETLKAFGAVLANG
jgi:hypothetical protein